MNNSSLSRCPQAEAVVNAPGFKALVSLEVLISTAAILSNALFLSMIWKVQVFHVNLKLLLGNLNFIILAYSLGFLVKSFSTLLTVWGGNICSFAMLSFDCKVSELLVAMPNVGVNYASLAVCLERVYCTIRYRRYDKSGLMTTCISVVLLLACYSVVFGHQLGFLFNIPRDQVTTFCENMLSTTPETAVNGISISFTTELITIVLSLLIYLYNKRQLKSATANWSEENLSSRFQLDQNVKVNRLLTPAMIFEGVCYVPTFIFLILLAVGFQTTIENKIFWIHVTYNFKLLFALFQPVFGFVLNKQLKKALRDSFPTVAACLSANTPKVAPIIGLEQMNPAMAASEHFDQAAKLWAKAPVIKAA